LQVTPRGQLRVFCHKGVGHFIAPVVTGFLSQYLEVSVDLRDADAMIDLVQEKFDLAIMPISAPDSTLVRRTLAKWHLVLCCAPAYLEKHRKCAVRRTWSGITACCTPTFSDHWPFLDARGNTVIARVSATLVTTSITVLRAAAIAGVGLWMSPPFIVSDLLASGELVPLLRDYWLLEMDFVAVYPHRRHMTAKFRAFVDMLVDRVAEEQRRLDAASD
jgi:DNA-binding transcriptional LysR family regulator